MNPGGRIGHAELDFGGTTLTLCDEYPEHSIARPDPAAGTSVTLHLHIDNANEAIACGLAADPLCSTLPPTRFMGSAPE